MLISILITVVVVILLLSVLQLIDTMDSNVRTGIGIFVFSLAFCSFCISSGSGQTTFRSITQSEI